MVAERESLGTPFILGTPMQGKLFNSVIPLTTQEASQVFKDPILKKRILRSRAAYRDKAKGQGPLKAKTRVVALGHLDVVCDLHRRPQQHVS